MLRNLQARGYVRQDPDTRRYSLGVKLWELGVVGIGGTGLRDEAGPWLRRLSAETGEQTTLWVYDDGDVVCVDRCEASHRVRSHTGVGAREPAHLLASGRVLLARQERDEVERVLARLRDAGEDADAVAARLERVRARDHEISAGDRWPDVYAIGAPIHGHRGVAAAAISVSGPRQRFEDDGRVRAIVASVTAAATECSARLGYPLSA